jgi:hypothetical protein
MFQRISALDGLTSFSSWRVTVTLFWLRGRCIHKAAGWMIRFPFGASIFLWYPKRPAQIYGKLSVLFTGYRGLSLVYYVWNVMTHAQKPDFVFRRNGRVHLNRREASVQSTTGSRDVRISGSNAGYTMFRGSVKGTGYPLHSPVSPSLPLPYITMYYHISTLDSTLATVWSWPLTSF